MKWLGVLVLWLGIISPLLAQQWDKQEAIQALWVADSLITAGQYDRAVAMVEQALTTFEVHRDTLGLAKSWNLKGLALHYKPGGYRQALPYYLKAEPILTRLLPESDTVLIILYNALGGALTGMGQRFEGRSFLEKSLDFKQKYTPEDSISIAVTRYNLGLSAMYFGERKQALTYFLNALPSYLNKYGVNGARVAQLYTNVGILYRDQGDFEHAIDYFERGVEIHLTNHGPDYWNLAYPYFNLSRVYHQMGDYEKALDYLQRTLDLSVKHEGLRRLESIAESALAETYQEQGWYDLAKKHIEKAIEIIANDYDAHHPRLAEYYQRMGSILTAEQDFDRAFQWFEKAKQLLQLKYPPEHPDQNSIHTSMARVYELKGDYPQALDLVQQGLWALSSDFRDTSWNANPTKDNILSEKHLLHSIKYKASLLKKMYEEENLEPTLLAQSNQQIRDAVEVIDFLRRGYVSESSKLTIQENSQQVYEMGIDNAFALYTVDGQVRHFDELFYFFEKSKATVLTEAIQSSVLEEVQGIPNALRDQEMELARYIRSLELKLQESQDIDHSSYMELKQQLFAAKLQRDSLSQAIQTNHPNYYDLTYHTDVISLQSVKEFLQTEDLLVSLFAGDSSWFVLGIHRHRDVAYSVPNAILNEKIRHFNQWIRNDQSDFDSIVKEGTEIYSQLLEPLLSQFAEVTDLMIIPDGILSYLAFDALTIPSTSEQPAEFLIQKYRVSYSNSATLRYGLGEEANVPFDETYAGFAPRYEATAGGGGARSGFAALTGNVDEVRFAADIFDGSMFIGAEATEERFKKLEGSPAILHLAMHGVVADGDPMHSKMIFSDEGSGQEDNFLHAYEIYDLSINSQLIILSACHTGAGEVRRGEGVMSLSRAFMYAGCPNIVLSLWQAKDQPTLTIVQSFLAQISDLKAKDEALQKAKLEYLAGADPLQKHPVNWATLTLWGDAHPIPISRKFPWLWLMLLVLPAAWLYYRRRPSTC